MCLGSLADGVLMLISCAGCDGFYGDVAVYCGSLFGDCFWLVSQDCTDIGWWLVG